MAAKRTLVDFQGKFLRLCLILIRTEIPVNTDAKAGEKCRQPKANAKLIAIKSELFRDSILHVNRRRFIVSKSQFVC